MAVRLQRCILGAVVPSLRRDDPPAISTTRDDPIVRQRCVRPMHESCASE